MNRRSEGGSCIAAIRTTTTPSTSRFHHASSAPSSSSDPATSGGSTWMRKGLPCVCFKRKGHYARICMNEERLRRLKNRTKVYFDSTLLEHQEALRVLWSSTFPYQELDGLISDQWKKMGWQGKDPSTDFRGAGFISLENLLFFAKTFSISFQRLIRKQGAKGAAWEYPFAVAGLNITFMLMKMLDLDANKPRTLVSAVFVHILSGKYFTETKLFLIKTQLNRTITND
ncbi:uncharacterized protein LOC143546988 [Bidens hawaiensis]|uniref:uncharacterized protein LOC143546988 n=1 Tax=Bidens hawaiensis TaxID=980011 RepID=UPI00404A25A1